MLKLPVFPGGGGDPDDMAGRSTLYYGDEAGVCGWTDPDSRRTYPWGSEDLELIEFHRYMTGIHNRLPVFKKGSVKPLVAKHQQIAFGRMYREYQAVTVVSNSPEIQMMEIPVWQLGITDDMILGRPILTMESGYNAGIMMYRVKNGLLKVNMPSYSAAVFISKPEDFIRWWIPGLQMGLGKKSRRNRVLLTGSVRGTFSFWYLRRFFLCMVICINYDENKNRSKT